MKDFKPTHVVIKDIPMGWKDSPMGWKDIPAGKVVSLWYEKNGFTTEESRIYSFTYVENDTVKRSSLHESKLNTYLLSLEKEKEVMLLPTDAKERKDIPITTGVLDYFPLAIADVAKLSKAGNDQHNPGEDLNWDRTKSKDHADCIARHLIDRGKFDTDNQRHSAKLAWRALALLQIELENEQEKGKS